MLILAVLATKGGSGKSTISAALAVEAARCGLRVGLVDLDNGQRSLSTWWAMRIGPMGLEGDRPIDLILPEGDPAETIRKAISGTFDVVIIDGPPGDIERTEMAVAAADFILAPSQPSPLDTLAMDALIELAQAAGKPLAFVCCWGAR
jgi:chromosome partitioning protein